jgi:hypothetical protein
MGNTSLELKGMKVQRRVRSVRASALVTCPGGNYFSRSEGIFFVPLLLGFDAPEILRFSALPPSFVTQSNMNRHQKNEFISYLLIILVHISVFHSIWATGIVCSRFPHGDKYVVPPERVNDNYCDCPVDGGIDETNTEACSGAVDGGWLGMDLPQHIRYMHGFDDITALVMNLNLITIILVTVHHIFNVRLTQNKRFHYLESMMGYVTVVMGRMKRILE